MTGTPLIRSASVVAIVDEAGAYAAPRDGENK